MKKYKTTIFIVLGVALLFLLLALPRLTDPNKKVINKWNDADIDCLNGHQNVASHIHPKLTIEVDSQEEIIPSEIGIVSSCMAEVHTHDSSGDIHVESVSPGKSFTLGQFFEVWDKNIERDGFNLKVSVNGQEIKNPEGLELQDRDDITLNYTSIESGS